MERSELLVSVIVPTFGRPQLVPRAVRSALTQTLDAIEVIVVVDGRDDATSEALGRIDDPRLRVVIPDRHLGNADARNTGIAAARGRWVAFLDDDDLWFPDKLRLQAIVAERSAYRHPIVACRLIARSEAQDFLWPRRLPAPGEPLSEYLFCRRSPFMGEGLITTSAIFTSRELLHVVRFKPLPRYVDVDWLLRAGRVDGAGVEFVPETSPFVVWHIERTWPRITDSRDWRYSLSYARQNHDLFTPRGYAAFVLHAISSDASVKRAWGACLPLMREAFQRGDPATVDVLSHLGNFLVPDGLRRRVAALFDRWRRPGPVAAPGRRAAG